MLQTLSWILYFMIFIGIIFIALYKYMTRNFGYWEKLKVDGPKPMPFYGNFYDIVKMKSTIAQSLKQLYDYTDAPYVGIYVFDKPVLLLRSPELIGDILVKDSHLFLDKTIVMPKHNVLTQNFLFFQTMPKWKENRTKFTPCFSPSKLKGMFPFISDIGEELDRYIADSPEIIDVSDLSGKYFIEVIARCMFGIKANSLKSKDAGFIKMYKGMFSFTYRNLLSQSAHFFFGELAEIFQLNFLEKSITDYLSDALYTVIKERKAHDGKAQDLIDIIIDMSKMEGKENLSQEEIEQLIANAMSFLVAGGETSTSTASNVFYEFAINQDIQEKARKEVLRCMEEDGGITYEAMLKTDYLEMCFYEAMRKYPAVPHFCRKSATDYKIRNTDLVLPKGTRIYIPLLPLHMNEKYFPEPQKYDPERFRNFDWSKDGKLVYIPFGAGPRRCLG
ncbi:hypothetical protein C4B38_000134 [Diabrotica virgifera virgifera]|uniref:Cytochrome P450 6j1-like n=1 Tax=Diabrotica virgifera virgifera TaxID=50390 RepID=A0A6P7FPM5_DIAVI|nr:hypothetical protein C4B38_000134 [Diabrotica virgifera virgifera]